MPAIHPTIAVASSEDEEAMRQIHWIGKSKLAMTDVMPHLLRLIRTMHSLNHLSFNKLEFITDTGHKVPDKAILLYHKVRNECQFTLRIKGVVGVRVSIHTRHSLSAQAVDSIIMLYSEKFQMEASDNVISISKKPTLPPQAKKTATPDGNATFFPPETPLGKYVGEPMSDEWLRYFYRNLKRAFQDRPAVVLTRDLMPVVKFVFSDGYDRNALTVFFKTEIASFAKKTADELGWEFHWKSVSDFINGEPRPTLPTIVPDMVPQGDVPKELSFVGRVILAKRRPELEARLQELQASEAEALLQMEEIQIRLTQIRSDQQAVQVDLARSILSPQDEEDLKKLQALIA